MASRIANALGAGYPVGSLAEVATADIILLNAASPEDVPRLIEELRHACIDWRRKCLLLYDAWADSTELRSCGAMHAATIGPMPGASGKYLCEGDRIAIRCAQATFDLKTSICVEIPPECKKAYLKACHDCSHYLAERLRLAELSFRSSGLDAVRARSVVEQIMTGALTEFRKGIRPKAPAVPLGPEMS